MWKKLKAVLELSRADHALLTAIAIIASYYYLTGSFSIPLELILVPVLLQLSVFIVNDIWDYRADLANNRVDRPLVRGDISLFEAKLWGIVLGLIALLLGLWKLPFHLLVFVIGVGVLSFLYNYKLKEMPFVGNVVVAFTMVAPFIYTMLYVGVMDRFLLLFSYAILFFGIAREIIKSIEDMEGDKKERKALTLPILVGIKEAKKIALVFWGIYLVLLAYLLLIAPEKLLLGAIFLGALYIAKEIWEIENSAQASKIKKHMLYLMFLGVLVLFLFKPFSL
ncbi:MAG: UbiA family prenyltransferase [Candidatus Micrarchaeota archaeon]|nr:UbiA family prenyltransferase [Candidatus Micrarchaeota archaeon]